MEDNKTYYALGDITLEGLISELDELVGEILIHLPQTGGVYDAEDIDYIDQELLDCNVEYYSKKLVPAGWLVTVHLYDNEETETPEEILLKEFVGYLKEHSCMYDYDTTGHYHSFRAVDVDDMDDLLEEFMEGKV